MAARPTLPVPLTADADLIAAFEVLGQKWTGIILHTLATRPARHGEPGTAIEHISTKVLADRLRRTRPPCRRPRRPAGHPGTHPGHLHRPGWLISTRLHRRLADTIRHAQLVEIPTGHLPMVERPDEWRQLITDFLGQHNAWAVGRGASSTCPTSPTSPSKCLPST